MHWCGYIDILGARELAKRSPQELNIALDRLHSALGDNFKYFADADCSAFSDGAFFRTSEFSNFFPFYTRVRNQLFQAGIFFRCSYIKGDISFADRETKENGVYANRRPPRFRSFTFGGSAPNAYQKESELKGAGCTIDPQYPKDELSELNIIRTYGVAAKSGRFEPHQFFDVRLSQFEISDEHETISKNYDDEHQVIDQIVYSAHSSSVDSAKAGSYYLPLLVLAVRSSYFKEISYQNYDWTAPYLFKKLFGKKSIIKALKDVPGLNFLLLTAFDQLYHDFDEKIPEDIERAVVVKLMSRPSCFKELANVPVFVISPRARRRLIEARAEIDNVKMFR